MMTTDPDDLPSFEDYQLPGYAHLGEARVLISVEIPASLLGRLDGAVRYAGDTGKIPGVETRTDLVRVALHDYLTQLETEHNDGEPFSAPTTSSRGRTAERDEKWTKISLNLPQSLRDRAQGAAAWAQTSTRIEGVTRFNHLIAKACSEYLSAIETEHNRGKVFQDPRARRR